MITPKYLLLAASLTLLAACGSDQGTGLQRDEDDSAGAEASDQADPSQFEGNAVAAGELGMVKQAIGEATCGTGTVDRVGARAVPPYNNPACSQAVLVGFKVSRPNTNAGLSIFTQITVSGTAAQKTAACAAARLHAFFYKNGSLVVQFDGGPGVIQQSSNCVISANYSFDTRVTGIHRSGSNITIGGAAPVAADNARFAVQALNAAGAQQQITFEPF